MILFELLTGSLPVDGEHYIDVLENIKSKPPRELSQSNRRLPAELQRICSACLQKNPSARYATAGELAADLRLVADDQPVVGKRYGLLAKAGYWCTREKRIADAGWFTIWSTLMLVAWLFMVALFLPWFAEVTPADLASVWKDIVFLFIFRVPIYLWIAWEITKGKRWAIWMCLVMGVVRLVDMSTQITEPVYFKSLYGQSGLSFVDHLAFVLCWAVQVFLFCCAAAADFYLHRRRKETY